MSVHWGGKGPGHISRLPKAAGESYDAASSALFARMSTQPDADRKALYDECITGFKGLNPEFGAVDTWTGKDYIIGLEGHDGPSVLLDWKGNFDWTAVGSPTFSDGRYALNGTTQYFNTNWNPSTSSNFTQNDGYIMNWTGVGGTDSKNNSAVGYGGNDASHGVSLIAWSTSDTLRGRLNLAGAVNYGPTVGSRFGYTALNRTASNVTNGFRGGQKSNNETSASTGRPNLNMFAGCLNNNATPASFTNNPIRANSVGNGHTDLEEAAFRPIMSYYLTTVRHGRKDRVLADMISIGRDMGTYAHGAYLNRDVTIYNGGYYVCHTSGTSASNPDVNTAMFVYLPLATAESTFLDDPFSANAGAVDGRLTPQGQAWATEGEGAASAVVASGYMTSALNTYFILRDLSEQISEITTTVTWPGGIGSNTNTLSISPNADLLASGVAGEDMWHENWGGLAVGGGGSASWWYNGDDAQAWDGGKLNASFGLVVPNDANPHTFTVKLRGEFLFGYLDGVLAFIRCDDLIATLCGSNAVSLYVQNHSADLGTERHTRLIVKTATIA
jgi:hypothetical protein